MPAKRKQPATAARGATAASEQRDAAQAEPSSLIGRRVDVPNGFWADEFDDGACTVGTVVKAGRQSGATIYKVAFGTQDGWSTPPAWIRLDVLVGLEPVTETCDARCCLHEAERPAKAARARAHEGASSKGKERAAPKAAGRDEEDLSELLEWTEGFDKPVRVPMHANARGGLKARLPAEPRAIDFHNLTCPEEVYQKVLEELLRQAEARGVDWVATGGEPDVLELKVFLAVTMYMNLKPLAVLYDYWESTIWGDAFVQMHFTRRRFEAILSNLHFEDPNERPEPVADGSDKLDPADRNWKLAAVQKMFTNAWCRAGAYTQYLAVDESMIKYRGGKDQRKQRLPSKPIKNGLKAFVLAGAHSPPDSVHEHLSLLTPSHCHPLLSGALGPLRGYVYNLSIYGGAGDGADDEAGAKASYVTRLLDPELDGKGYVVVTDNFYTSERLATELNLRGIGFVGTCNANMSTFAGFSRPEIGEVQSGPNAGAKRYGRAVEPQKYRTAYKPMPTLHEDRPSSPPLTPQACVTTLSDRLYYATWSDSSKINPVNLLANFCEAEHATCTRRPKVATDDNPRCAKEERECPWLATVYGAYYGGVDTADMDIALSRFDHKSSVEDGCRSYLRVWWALHGWGITNGWRLRRVWEAEDAESNDWYHYPSGRVFYTRLRAHMKELVTETIAEAVAKGWQPTRQRPGPKYVPGSTQLDPVVCEHDPDYAGKPQRCRCCGQETHWFCPGCRKLDGGQGGAGYYCLGKHRNCFAQNHRKRRRTV